MRPLDIARSFARGAAKSWMRLDEGLNFLRRHPAAAAGRTATALVRDASLSRVYGTDPIGVPDVPLVGSLLGLVLAYIGFQVGAAQFLANLDTAGFYQPLFSPALSLACTGQLDQLAATPEITEFLSGGSLPNGCDRLILIHTDAWNAIDYTTLYLYGLAALSWNLFGFEWESLFFAAGILNAMLAVGAYLLMRCFCSSRLIAFGLALLIVFSNPILDHIPHLRDFSKAPLIFLALGMAGRVITRGLPVREAVVWALMAGAVVALGKGFRSDVVMVAPIVLVCFVVFAYGATLKERARSAAFTIGAFVVGYIIAGLPVDLENGSREFAGAGIGHVFILGFAEQFFSYVNMHPTGYTPLRAYQDEAVYSLVSLYKNGHGADFITQAPLLYENYSRRMFMDIVATTPSDVYMRVFATANALGGYAINYLVYGPILVAVCAIGSVTLQRSTALLALSAAVVVSILSLQFASRHNFFAVFIGAAGIGIAATIMIDALIELVLRVRRKAWRGQALLPLFQNVRGRAIMSAIVVVGVIALGAGAAAITSEMQRRALSREVSEFEQLEWRQVPFSVDSRRVNVAFDSSEVQAISSGRANGEAEYGFVRINVLSEPIDDSSRSPIAPLWSAAQPGARVWGRGLNFASSGDPGYQFVSREIATSELERDAQGNYVMNLELRGESNGGWSFGVQKADGSAWIHSIPLAPGALTRRLRFEIPGDETSVRLIIEASLPNISPLRFSRLQISGSLPTDCRSNFYSIGQNYRNPLGSITTPWPQDVTGTGNTVYYAPYIATRGWSLESFEFNGIWPGCARSVEVAVAAPPHTLPMELLITPDSSPADDRRTTWGQIWSDFWQWSRTPTYP